MAKQEKVIEKKAPAKRGRKPKVEQEPVTMMEFTEKKFSGLEQKLLEDRELFFDLISNMRKRINTIERINYTFDCIVLTITLILAFILLSK